MDVEHVLIFALKHHRTGSMVIPDADAGYMLAGD
jgi:hypothetical protein